ncbi:MAG: hypothetical protein J2P13_05225 [Acidobacteria bacterium]|nr:hypothetical protein [Acidobacteriota bacterium]
MAAIALVVCCVLSLAGFSFAEEKQEKTASPRAHIGIGIKISSLGAGAEVALPLLRHSSLRAGFNYFLYDHDLASSGVGYRGELNLRSAQASFDWYPFHGRFHVGPTVLVYNASHVQAKVAVPAGQVFTLTNNTYQSDAFDPIHGTASMTFPKLAPGVLVGWGNLAGRRKHFTVPFELGLIFEGAPHVSLNLTGTGCDVSGLGCSPLRSDPAGANAIRAEQQKIAREVTFLRVYPVVSVGLGYSF